VRPPARGRASRREATLDADPDGEV